jgi:hypothetical protein
VSHDRAASLAAASYVLRHHDGDRETLRELLYALDLLPDPDVARRHARRTVVNSRPPIDDELRQQVHDLFMDGLTFEEIAERIDRAVPVTKRILTGLFAAASEYIADPDARAAWMAANASEYVRVAPAGQERAA